MQLPSSHYLVAFCCCLASLAIALPPITDQQPQIIETVYMEKDQGLKARVINHSYRDASGYFYFISRNSIQRYDGKTFAEVEVDLAQLGHPRESLQNIISTTVFPHETILTFASGIELSIASGGLGLQGPQLARRAAPAQTKADNPQFELKPLDISREGITYRWEEDKVTKIHGDKQTELTVFEEGLGRPKFLRMDLMGNIIAAYSNSTNHVEKYYVLSPLDSLYDFSHVAAAYPTAKDIYVEDAFYKWMISGFNGVKIITLKREGVEFIRYDSNVAKGQFGELIMGMTSDGDKLYFTNETGSFCTYDPDTKVWVQEPEAYSFVSGTLGKMDHYHNSDKIALLGSETAITDFYLIDNDEHSVELHQLDGYHRDFLIQPDGSILFVGGSGVSEGTITAYDPKTRIKTKLKTGFPPFRCIRYDEYREQYYLGTKAGLLICDKDFNVLAKFAQGESENRSLPFDDVVFLLPYADHLLAGTLGGGLYIVDIDNYSVIKRLTEKDGLTDQIVISGLIDEAGRCWLGTFNGLNVIDSSFSLIKTIYEFDGLPSREFNSFSATAHQGELYFGTINGAVRIDPEKVMNWKRSNKLNLKKLWIHNQASIAEVNIGSEVIDVADPDSISILYDITDFHTYPYVAINPNISFEGTPLNITQAKNSLLIKAPEKGMSFIQLGLDPQSTAQELRLNITADYSKWKRWFLTILSIVFLSAIIVFYVSAIIRNREKQKTARNKKISELQLSALQGQMNPHFIFNALGAIQYFIQTNDAPKADEYLSDFALLMRGILDSSSKKFITLKEELKLLRLYVGLEKARFEDKFEVDFIIGEEVDEETLIPPMIIQPYIENAVNHGLHHLKDRKGKLEIKFGTIDDLLVATIQDNGVGRAAAEQLKPSRKHKSWAMGITAERINTINASSDIFVSIAVDDLVDHNKMAAGTKVTVKIKD